MDREKIIEKISLDRPRAHAVIFAHRHKDETPHFHEELINLWHDHRIQRLSIQAFRHAAKSTAGCEEATIIQAILHEFKNGLIVGEKYERACERLEAIKHELDNNEFINGVFGPQRGSIWTHDKIELSNGTIIQAVGRNQSLRGSKHHDQRPDYLVVDDLEDKESVATEEAKRATLSWFMSVLLPAMDRTYRARVVGTPLETGSLMETLESDPAWVSRKYPIEYIDTEGNRRAMWEERFPLADIDKIRGTFERMGMLLEYGREYLCEARSGATKQFSADMLKIESEIRKPYHAVYVYYDPARTTNKKTSAMTGKAVWSWIGNRLKVWEASGHFFQPDEMINDIFETAEKYNPVEIGIEPDGLEEFILQPLRHEASKRNTIIPIRPIRAPKGKIDFIRGLQPFFKSGECTLAQPCPDLVQQLLNFPVGRMDVPNALAYALLMRPGMPVYEDFSEDHILPPSYLKKKRRYALAIGFHAGIVTGVLYTRGNRTLVIHKDYVFEGDPQQRTAFLIDEAREDAGGKMDVVCHFEHFERYSTSGVVGALRRCGVDVRRGGDVAKGRSWIVDALPKRKDGKSFVSVSPDAKWVLNGFLGGYCYEMLKGAKGSSDRAREGVYRTMFEALESAVSMGAAAAIETTGNYSFTKTGKRYLSTLSS